MNAEKRRGFDSTACISARDVTPEAARREVLEKRTNARDVIMLEVGEWTGRKRVERCL